jgi:hypothetical protein
LLGSDLEAYQRKHGRGADYDEDGEPIEPAPECTEIQYDEVIKLLRSIDSHRDALAANAATIWEWLEFSDELYAAWRAFCAQGGITADDFDRLWEAALATPSGQAETPLTTCS